MPQDHKEQKYDRQLRLWGFGGQKRLEEARICLINATGVGSETMKNLVLPGIGHFLVVDPENVSHTDLSNNFFVTPEDIGKPRAEVVTKWLTEMNADAKGEFQLRKPEEVANREFLKTNRITIVIATQLGEATSLALSEACAAEGVGLVVARSYGMMGYLRLQVQDHPVIEGFPDQELEDLRLMNPFPGLSKFQESVGNPDSVEDSLLHAHIPWVSLVMHYVGEWKKANPDHNAATFTYTQRKEIQKLINAGARKDEENFAEAIKGLNTSLAPAAIPEEVLNLFKAPQVEASSHPFWLCVYGLREFHKQNGVLPIKGRLADMTCTTQWFVKLQDAYQEQAKIDQAEVLKTVNARCEELSSLGDTPPTIDPEYVALFCKNAFAIRYVNSRLLTEEMSGSSSKDAIKAAQGEEDIGIAWYLLMRAGDRFHKQHDRFPGQASDAALDEEAASLQKNVEEVTKELQVDMVDTELIKEWTRYGGAEVHNISSVMGGMASQEVIKMVTCQRVPVNNTAIFEGMKSKLQVHLL